MRQYYIFANNSSGSAHQIEAVKAAFKQYPEVAMTIYSLSALSKQRSKILKQTEAVVVAAGGDGTVNAVVNTFKDSAVIVGVLPLGTLNHFAKDLGVSTDIAEAVRGLIYGAKRKVDIASVNGHYFVNNSSIGLYPSLVAAREKRESQLGKPLASVIAFFTMLRSLRRHHITIEMGDKKITARSPFVFIGNNHYSLQQQSFTDRKSLTNGKLGIYVLRSRSLPGALWALIRSAHTKPGQAPELDYYEPTIAIITLRHRHSKVAFDGEVQRLTTPLHYTLHKRHLTVLT